MSKFSHVHTIRLPLRKLCSTLPAVALIGGGLMLPASAASTTASGIGLASENSPAVVVPGTELTVPSSPAGSAEPSPERSPRAPASRPPVAVLPAGVLPGSPSPVTLDSAGIPVRALEGYRTAAALIGSADPSCHLDWPLVGAIGRVESDHGRFGGNQLDTTGTARPGIIGIPLDGSNATARITDTDHGVLDHDTVFDRAVGPMQFIPGTWASAGVDANGDGVKDPQNIADAATATSAYLCSAGGDLRRPADLRSAILRYNPSDSYVSMVTAIADAYRHGVKALPASDVSPVQPSTAASLTSAAGGPARSAAVQPVAPGSATATANAKAKAAATAKARATANAQATAKAKATAAAAARKATSTPALTPRPLPTSVPAVTQVPGKTVPGSPRPTPSTSTTPPPPAPTSSAPPTPSPTTTCVPIPSATSPAPTSTQSADASPQPTQTCLPACAPGASPTSSASPTPAQTCLPPCPATAAPTSSTSTATAPACLTPTASTPSAKTTP